MKEDWIDINNSIPENDLPCEYQITVTCRGWYRPAPNEARFAGDERLPPSARVTAWRPWKDGEPWLKGQKLVREHRQKLKEERKENES